MITCSETELDSRSLRPAQPPVMASSECVAIISRQMLSLYNAAQKGPDASENGAAKANQATPLKPTIDASDPTTWSARRKWSLTFLVGLTMFNGSFASTAPNGAGTGIVKQFDLSNEELAFIASSFIGGCVAGPVLWGPLSETWGRRPIFLTSTLLYSLTNIGCALAPTKGVLFPCRFAAGIFASSAFSNAAAVITDLFAPPHRASPMIVASLAPLLGPCFGPLFGSVVSLYLRWRFVFWLMGAFGLALEAALFFLPETYAPVLAARVKPKESTASAVSTRGQKIRAFLVANLARPVSIVSEGQTESEVRAAD